MLVTIQWMYEKYNYYNDLLFEGNLPSINFYINNSRKTWGYATYRFDLYHNRVWAVSITMSNKFDSPEKVKIATLIHEMIHIADYTFNPHHFIRNGRKVSGRSYDAHGYIYFIPQMNRINQMLKNEGIVISTNVTEEEINQSELNSAAKAHIKNKIESGVHVLISKLKKQDYKNCEYTMAVVQNSMFPQWKNYITNSEWWASEFLYTDDYLTDSETLAMKRSRKVGYSSYLEIPLDNLIEKYNLKLNGRIYGEEPESEVEPIVSRKAEEPINNEPHLIPLFRFKTNQGNTIEIKNRTKEEIELILRTKFPNWSDKTIQTIMNLKSCYPMGESKVKLTESDIAKMVEEVVNNLTNNETTAQVPGQRRSKIKQIGQYEYEESIE